jgi:peptidoglycan/xylan/chitin deacetylase (PgdA/CDA1 family)
MGTGLFSAQMRLLTRRYRVVPAGELLAAVQARRRGRRIPVAVTFDDDRASHARSAMPILLGLGMPATFFLSGASLHAPHAFWSERLQLAFDRGQLDADELFRGTSFSPEGARSAGLRDLAEAVKALPAEESDRVAERLLESLGSDPPDAGIRATDVRALAGADFEVGFHTRRHYILPGLDDQALARALREGRAELAAEVGSELSLIAYPNGDADARVAAATRAAGYRLGFTTEPRAVLPDTDPMLIGRLGGSHESPGRFAFRVAVALRPAPRR